ncbi:MAG: hypothetical protein AAF604_04790 [Acidobacteriota bacterium]
MTARDLPILFSAPMVRAILDGSKTQTRRLIKAPAGAEWLMDELPDGTPLPLRQIGWGEYHPIQCPYGASGNRLWVREEWGTISVLDPLPPRSIGRQAPVHYRADGAGSGRWRRAFHMPRWVSRITLEVLEVCPERLQKITQADLHAEGFDELGAFAGAWDEIHGQHGPESWAGDPWVWAIRFRVAEVRQ